MKYGMIQRYAEFNKNAEFISSLFSYKFALTNHIQRDNQNT